METASETQELTEELPQEGAAVEEPNTQAAAPESDDDEGADELPEEVRAKLRKKNSENRNLRQRLRELEQELEPLKQAAQEAERANMSELERERADREALAKQLAQRETDLLVAKYGIPEDFVEFIGEGTFEEKESRAAKVGQMVQSKDSHEPHRPPTERPVESLKPGASPSTPPVEDHSYPAGWIPQQRGES